MQLKGVDTYMLHYTVAVVVNIMLGSFIVSNEDALKYFKSKISSWQDQKKLNAEIKCGKKLEKGEFGPWMESQPAGLE